MSPFKLLFAFGILVGGSYVFAVPLIYPRSIEAITNARLAVVRASIDGKIERAALADGGVINRGEYVARIVNQSSSATFLMELNNDYALTSANVKALDNQIALLASRKSDLESLVTKSRNNLVERLRSQLVEQKLRVDSYNADYLRLKAMAGMQQHLADRNYIVQAKLDVSIETAEVARIKLEIEKEHLKQCADQLSAAEAGLIFDLDGSITSARLRIDELDERLYLLNTERAAKSSKLQEVQTSIERERNRLGTVSRVDIDAPIAGRIWQVDVATDEFVKQGDAVVEIADCGDSIVTATVSERIFDNLEIGETVEFVPENGTQRIPGRVIQANGPSTRVDSTRFAIRPAQVDNKEFRVIVKLDRDAMPSFQNCSIGTTGKILFPPIYPIVLVSVEESIKDLWAKIKKPRLKEHGTERVDSAQIVSSPIKKIARGGF